MNALIIDDEKQAAETLKLMLEKYCKGVRVLQTFLGLEDIRNGSFTDRVDVVFLDINFGEYDGFDLIRKVDFGDAEIVFVTAHDNYGIQAVKEGAFDYIVKPVSPEELIECTDKLSKKKLSVDGTQQETRETMLIPVNNTYVKVNYADIDFIEADGAYSTIHCGEDRYLSSKRIGLYLDLLPKVDFVRVHHSYLVNVRSIKLVKAGRDQPVVLHNGMEIPVARNRRKQLMEVLGG